MVRDPLSSPRSSGAVPGRAAVLVSPRRVELRQVYFPPPLPSEVRVKMQGCGICASNVPVWEGRPWFDYPREPGAPGHEGWGVVDVVGSQVTAVQPGDRVSVLSYHAFADYDLADQQSVVKLPDQLEEASFLGEPLACAMNIFSRSDIQPGQLVAILGIGYLGALLTQLATAAGARVIAVSQRAFARETARRYGATHVFSYDQRDELKLFVQSMTDRRGCPRVIEATGLQAPLDLATELVGVRGKLIIAGYHQDGLRQVHLQLWNWKGIDVINAHERDASVYIDGMRQAVNAVAAGWLQPQSLLTHRFPLTELAGALEAACHRDHHFLKAAVLIGDN